MTEEEFERMQRKYDVLWQRTKHLEDALVAIGQACLHTPYSPIWKLVRSVVGENGEKRIT